MLEKTYQIIETGEVVEIREYGYRNFDIMNCNMSASLFRGAWGVRARSQWGPYEFNNIELISIYALLRK